MSVQFGRWHFDGQPPASEYLERVSASLAPYAPDANQEYSNSGLNILHRPFCTTKESWREKQPYISQSGAVITWDGRLDNRADLIKELKAPLVTDSTDVAIVAAAYEKWGHACFGRLIGDWALSIWNPRSPSITLAKDPVGTRQLYYAFERGCVTWCTILDPLIMHSGRTFKISEEYVAGWFAYFPGAHLTPYDGIHAVPPSSLVVLRPGKRNVTRTVRKYWDFDAGKTIRYRSDAEYEEHFRSAFAQAVQRCLRSDQPILAELSGGMDSASIVCMADVVMARGQAECPHLDTISWFDDSYDHIEPDTNELHWVTEVEERRHRSGHHINLAELKQSPASSHASFLSEFESEFREVGFAATPVPSLNRSELFKLYSAYVTSHGYRVTLSGIGGSEFLGDGVPTPKQELQNLLVRGHFLRFLGQLKAWSAKMRKPRLPVVWETMRDFLLPFPVSGELRDMCPPLWFDRRFVRRNRVAFRGYLSRVKLAGPLPSFQGNRTIFEYLQRLLACGETKPLNEPRYPCLDRDLLEFLFAIPREQIVRLGQRRSLMKRALVGIVPDSLLTRRRKVPVVPDSLQEPASDATSRWPGPFDLGPLISSAAGIVDSDRFAHALQKARRNEGLAPDRLMQTLRFEVWLRYVSTKGFLMSAMPTKVHGVRSPIGEGQFQASDHHKSLAS